MTPRTIRIGDVEVPRIGMGTNRLTHTASHERFVRDAAGSGIGMIDTAHLYAGGESETTIGAALDGGRSPCVIATKGGYTDGRAAVLRLEIENSLQRLRTGVIELYYLHRPDREASLEESLGLLNHYREAGTIRHVGISAVTIEQIERAARVVPITAVQNQYNVGERSDDDVVDYCEAHGIVFVPYYPLRADHHALGRVARRHGATPAQIALSWLLHRSPVVVPIPGTLSLAHAKENVGALDIDLSDDDLGELRKAA
ncbi:MAG: aldo/keto reductase [Candidatus Dormibacteria bacterium]